MLSLFGPGRTRRSSAASLYAAAVIAGRRPVFYAEWDVPDTLDGRFDMIALHVVLVCRRLSGMGRTGAALSQALFDTMLQDMDRSLREMGVGDTGVGKRVKTMAKALLGRVEAYDLGLSSGEEALAAAVMRNVFRSDGVPSKAAVRIAAYAVDLDRRLLGQDDGALLDGRVDLGTGG